jgi:hybrid cluster-associated redox disulfide protein
MSDNAMPNAEILGRMIITDVLERWPQTADVFHNHNMACVGCAVAPFYSVRDAALVYNLPPDEFIDEMLALIGAVAEGNTTYERDV